MSMRGTCKTSQYVKDSRIKEAILRRLSEDFTTEKKLSYKSAKRALAAEILDLQEQMIFRDRETPKIQEARDMKPSIQSVVEFLSSAEGSNVEKHEAITSVIESCIFDKQKNLLEIQYRYLAPTSYEGSQTT